MPVFIVYKPFGMLSQFTKEVDSHVTLADLEFSFAKNVYPVGRLDSDSEGLLILTDEKKLNARLLNPKNKQPKTYWVQVEGEPIDRNLQPLRNGVTIKIKGKEHQTQPAIASLLKHTIDLPERNPPIRYRASIPDTWVEITLIEGKNRQVRRMFASIGFPVLRLVRIELAGLKYNQGELENLKVGEVRKIEL